MLHGAPRGDRRREDDALGAAAEQPAGERAEPEGAAHERRRGFGRAAAHVDDDPTRRERTRRQRVEELALVLGLECRDRHLVGIERAGLHLRPDGRACVRGSAVELRERDVLLFGGHLLDLERETAPDRRRSRMIDYERGTAEWYLWPTSSPAPRGKSVAQMPRPRRKYCAGAPGRRGARNVIGRGRSARRSGRRRP